MPEPSRISTVFAALILLVGCSADDNSATSNTAAPTTGAPVVTEAATTEVSTTEATTVPTTTPVAPQWMWAWLQDPAQIVAVNTDGRSNFLVDTPDPATLNNLGLWQVGNETAVAMYTVGSAPTVYVLTPTGATEVDFPAVDMAVPSNAWSVEAVSEPYLAIRYMYGVSEAMVVINSDTAEATLVSAGVADLPRAAIFAADGRYLRFVATTSDGASSKVVERDLVTGIDRTLYSYSNYDHVLADSTGDVWLDYRTGDVIAADGRPTNALHSSDTDTGRWLTGEWTMTYSYGCASDCTLTLAPVFGSEPAMTYMIPEKTARRGLASWMLDDQSLLVLDRATSSYWRLLPDGGGELIGHRDPNQSFSGLAESRYVVFSTGVGEPAAYDALLDIETGEIIPLPVAAGSEGGFALDGQRDGLFLTHYENDGGQSVWLMPYLTRSFAPLTTDAQTVCYVLLDDGSAICYGVDPGIYRYEPASGALTRISDLVVYFLGLRP